MRAYGCCAVALAAAAQSPHARAHEINAWRNGPPGHQTLVQLHRVRAAAAELAGEQQQKGRGVDM
jgi:hypothetical protein